MKIGVERDPAFLVSLEGYADRIKAYLVRARGYLSRKKDPRAELLCALGATASLEKELQRVNYGGCPLPEWEEKP